MVEALLSATTGWQQQRHNRLFVNPTADHGGGAVVGHNGVTTAAPQQIVCKSYRRSWWRRCSWPQQDKDNSSATTDTTPDHGGGAVVSHNRMTTAEPQQIVCKSYRRSWWRHWSWPQQDKINNSNKIVCETHHTLLAKKWNVAEIHYYACISVSPLHFLYFLTVQVSLLLLNLLWYAC